jgi:hypothetical protein
VTRTDAYKSKGVSFRRLIPSSQALCAGPKGEKIVVAGSRVH